MTRLQSPAAVHVVVETRGEVSLAAPDYARTKLQALLARVDEPVLAALCVPRTSSAHVRGPIERFLRDWN
jgi:hypothetical protein